MAKLAPLFILCISMVMVVPSYAQNKYKIETLISKVYELFSKGEYEEVNNILNQLQEKKQLKNKKVQGLLFYWKAMTHARLNEFPQAEELFQKALELNYLTDDIYYEYGQVLYVSEKLKRARIAFKQSVKKKYKVGVSLYYIAFISQELKDYKRAVSFYHMIEKLPIEDKKDVIQAARMQIGDIYLIQIERQRDPFTGMEKYVVPQYKKALEWDQNSPLAKEIKDKIEKLQRRYELVLFKMRNGKPTARPPYYLRVNALYGINDNTTLISKADQATKAEKDYSSPYYQLGAFYRHSYYPNSSYSYAPELSAGHTMHTSTSENILPYNKYYMKAALKVNYEHLYKALPATMYLDFDYTYNADDADADEKFAASDTTYGFQLSEELQMWANNPTTFRFRYENVAAEVDTAQNTSFSFNYEQVFILNWATLFWFNSYRMTSFPNAEENDINTLTSRMDIILPTFYRLFNPTLYFSYMFTAYPNNSDRGVPGLSGYGVNLSRPLSKRYYLTFDYGVNTQNATLEEDNYNQSIMTLNLDYIY